VDVDGKGSDVAVMKLAVQGMAVVGPATSAAVEEGWAGLSDDFDTAADDDCEEEAGVDACDEEHGEDMVVLNFFLFLQSECCCCCCCGVRGGEGVVVSAEGSEVAWEVGAEEFMEGKEYEKGAGHEDMLRWSCSDGSVDGC